MTPELTNREQTINSILRFDRSVKTPTKKVYINLAKTGKDVNEFREETIKQLKGTGVTSTEKYKRYTVEYFEYDKQFYDIAQIERKKMFMDATEEFFGLKFGDQKLLYEIADEAYLHSVIGIGDEETDYMQQRYFQWLKGCMMIDNIDLYIKLMYPDFNKKQRIYRKQIEELSKKIPDEMFFHVLHAFFEKYKSLNKITKAKIDELLLLGLPNIDIEEAKKIVNMVKFQK